MTTEKGDEKMPWEWSLLEGIKEVFQSPFMDSLMLFFTRLGDGGFIWILVGILLIFTKKYRKQGVILLLALLSGLLVGNALLKNLVARPRPSWLMELPLLIENPTDYSFPSGHTLSSFIAATVLTLTNKKWGYWAYPLATLIAFSRLYLGVHFPTDVFFAILLGLLLGTLVFFGMRKFFLWRARK